MNLRSIKIADPFLPFGNPSLLSRNSFSLSKNQFLLSRNSLLSETLFCRLEAVEGELATEREDAQEQQLQLSREIDRLELENQALKDEVESVMHHRRTASLGLESAMQALNLSREGSILHS